MRTYTQDRLMSDKYIPAMKNIIKDNALSFIDFSIAPRDKDINESTDMIATVKGGGDIALRIRATKFRDFTIRSFRKGKKTELEKLRSGYCDYYLYCWIGNWGDPIDAYVFIDMNKLRKENIWNIPRGTRMNKDKTTGFIFIPIKDIPDECIISRLNI